MSRRQAKQARMAVMLTRHRTLRRCPVGVRRSRWDTLHWWWARRAARDEKAEPITLGDAYDAVYFRPGLVISCGEPLLRVIGVAIGAGMLRTVVDRWPYGDWGDGGDD